MKFKRGTYPSYPGANGSPCWKLESRWLTIDADLNTGFPFGTSCSFKVRGITLLLDINAPLGEPNRIYFTGPKRHYMIGLIGFHRFKETGRSVAHIGKSRREVPCIHGHNVLTWPHIIRGQKWDWKKSEGTMPPIWKWIVITPNDYRERWERAHPQEAQEMAERRAKIPPPKKLEDGSEVWEIP